MKQIQSLNDPRLYCAYCQKLVPVGYPDRVIGYNDNHDHDITFCSWRHVVLWHILDRAEQELLHMKMTRALSKKYFHGD